MERVRTITVTAVYGLSWCAFVVVMHAVIGQRFGFDAMRLWVNLILPFGAICLGLLASLGFVIGARYSNYPARLPLIVVMIGVATGAFIAMPIISYYSESFEGIPIAQLVSLADYFQTSLTTSSMKVSRFDADAYDLGKAGFILPLGNLIGLIGGMLVGFLALRAMPHCQKCRVYFETVTNQTIRFPDQDKFVNFISSLPRPSFARLQFLTNFRSGFSPALPKKGMWTVRFGHTKCPDCQDQFVTEQVYVYDGQQDRSVADFSENYPLMKTGSAGEPAVQSTSPPLRQFGRRKA